MSFVHSYGTNWEECSFSFSVSSQSIGTQFASSLGSGAGTTVGCGGGRYFVSTTLNTKVLFNVQFDHPIVSITFCNLHTLE